VAHPKSLRHFYGVICASRGHSFFSQVAPPLELEHPGQRLSQNDLYFGFGHLPQAARYEFLAPLSVPPKLKAVRGRFVLLSPFLSFEQNFRTYLF
jgi:hypothetical protein